jgi:hypothetical protein
MTVRAWLRVFWRRLREWSGDAAYETYVARARGGEVLDREAFYLDSLRAGTNAPAAVERSEQPDRVALHQSQDWSAGPTLRAETPRPA